MNEKYQKNPTQYNTVIEDPSEDEYKSNEESDGNEP